MRGRPGSGNLSVVGLQWGDEGKGKVVDYIAGDFDAVARFNGGSNAGHTVVLGKRKYTFHLVPSGALKEKELLIGAGVVLDPIVLGEELAQLPSQTRNRLVVDGRCTLVSPLEREFDGFLEGLRGSSAIGTTRRGIGPSYAMRALRLALRAGDLSRGGSLHELEAFYQKLGIHSDRLDVWAKEARTLLDGMIGDAGAEVMAVSERGGSVLFEASQGALLDLLHGSYPFVTSSHTLVSYIPAGLGIPPHLAGEPIGVAKCYTTRVGSGPFPTEIEGPVGEGLRREGNEYGSTTGRPRRVGWLDLVALKYAIRLNGVKKLAITKLDVLSGINEFKVCVAYDIEGEETANFQRSLQRLGEAEPVYETPFTMFGAEYSGSMPSQAKKLVEYVEHELGVDVVLVSYGEDRTQTRELDR